MINHDKKRKNIQLINQSDNYKGLIRTGGDEAFEIVEQKLKQTTIKRVGDLNMKTLNKKKWVLKFLKMVELIYM